MAAETCKVCHGPFEAKDHNVITGECEAWCAWCDRQGRECRCFDEGGSEPDEDDDTEGGG
jgi:hypothetical protein